MMSSPASGRPAHPLLILLLAAMVAACSPVDNGGTTDRAAVGSRRRVHAHAATPRLASPAPSPIQSQLPSDDATASDGAATRDNAGNRERWRGDRERRRINRESMARRRPAAVTPAPATARLRFRPPTSGPGRVRRQAAAAFAINLYSKGDFVAQYTFEWCVGASLQMALNMATDGSRTSAADQEHSGRWLATGASARSAAPTQRAGPPS